MPLTSPSAQSEETNRAEHMAALLRHEDYYEGRNPFQRLFNRWRIRQIRILCGDLTQKKVLDVGIGEGYLARELKVKELWGIELSPSRSALAERNAHAHVLVGNAEALPFPDASFDAALCTDVLEHMDHPLRAIAEMRRVVRPGGFIVVSVPNEPLLTLLKTLLLQFPAKNPDHLWSFTPTTLREAFTLKEAAHRNIPNLPYPLCVWQAYRFTRPR